MVLLAELWLPVLLSAVFVFIASSVIHMMSPMHKSDYRALPDEEAVLDALRAAKVGRGHYVFPHCKSMQEMASTEMKAKYDRGPVGYVTVGPDGPMQMGKSLAQWFAYSIVIGIFVAYIASISLPRGVESSTTFRLTGAAACLGYCLAYVPDSIWKLLDWKITFKFMLDGLVYGLLTAGTFAWLWPTT